MVSPSHVAGVPPPGEHSLAEPQKKEGVPAPVWQVNPGAAVAQSITASAPLAHTLSFVPSQASPCRKSTSSELTILVHAAPVPLHPKNPGLAGGLGGLTSAQTSP